MHGGIHPKAESVSDLSTLTGGWKVLIYLDPYNISGYKNYMLLNGTFLTDGKEVTLKLKYDRAYEGDEGKELDQSGNAEELYSGTWDKTETVLMGSYIKITLKMVYQADGVQYMAGDVIYNSGETGYIAFVRPSGVGAPFEMTPDDEGI